jgi:hypothetical protein
LASKTGELGRVQEALQRQKQDNETLNSNYEEKLKKIKGNVMK